MLAATPVDVVPPQKPSAVGVGAGVALSPPPPQAAKRTVRPSIANRFIVFPILFPLIAWARCAGLFVSYCKKS